MVTTTRTATTLWERLQPRRRSRLEQTGPVAHRKASRLKPLPQRPAGFTLIEIVAVMLLIALVIGIVTFTLSGNVNSAKVRAAGRDLVAAMRYTRGQAIVSGEEQVLELDVEARTYRAPKREVVELPGKMELRLVTAETEQTGATTGAVRFYPDGSSTGGRVRLLAGEREWNVEIAWLTGEVRLSEVRQ